jgi:hypothetical protein
MISNNHLVYFGLLLNKILDNNSEIYFSHSKKSSIGQLFELIDFIKGNHGKRIVVLDFSNNNLIFLPLINLLFYKSTIHFNINHNLNSSIARNIIFKLHSFRLVTFLAINNSVGLINWLTFPIIKPIVHSTTASQYVIFNPRRRDQIIHLNIKDLYNELIDFNALEKISIMNSINFDYEMLYCLENTVFVLNYSYSYYRHSGVVFDAHLKGIEIYVPCTQYYMEIFGKFPNVKFYS